MKSSSPPTILILGAQGMLGRIVFTYLSLQLPKTVFGTIRKENKNKAFFGFDAHSLTDLENIYKKLGKIDYIINCIGILRSDKNIKEMQYINTDFPHKLSRFAEKKMIKLIHISTDAIFAPTEKIVKENSNPSPIDLYGKAKLAGEPLSDNAITIRTSVIGFDPYKHKGLFEWALHSQSPLNGYTNQLWSGCTTLQFTKLCEQIIKKNSFHKMRRKSSVFHFVPLVNLSKHDIIKMLLSLMHSNKKVVRQTSDTISRQLRTKYPGLLFINQQEKKISNAVEELLIFEKEYVKTYESK